MNDFKLTGPNMHWLAFLFINVLFWSHWYPCFGFLVTCPLGFRARVGSALFTLYGGKCNVHSLRSSSGATPVALLMTSIAAGRFPTCISRGGSWLGFKWAIMIIMIVPTSPSDLPSEFRETRITTPTYKFQTNNLIYQNFISCILYQTKYKNSSVRSISTYRHIAVMSSNWVVLRDKKFGKGIIGDMNSKRLLGIPLLRWKKKILQICKMLLSWNT